MAGLNTQKQVLQDLREAVSAGINDITTQMKDQTLDLLENIIQQRMSCLVSPPGKIEEEGKLLDDAIDVRKIEKGIQSLGASGYFNSDEFAVVQDLKDELQQQAEDFARELEDRELQVQRYRNKSQQLAEEIAELTRLIEKMPDPSEVDNLAQEVDELKAIQSKLVDRSEVWDLEDKMKLMETIHREQVLADAEKYKALFQQLADLKGNIRVLVRIRYVPGPSHPIPQGADDERPFVEINNPDEHTSLPWQRLQIVTQEKPISHHGIVRKVESFEGFERVFGQEHTNNDIFREISDIAQSALYGKPVTVLGYGQTGSGKTYTFLHEDGIVPRYFKMIFQIAEDEFDKYSFSFMLSAGEVYLGSIYDLLHGTPPDDFDDTAPKKEQIIEPKKELIKDWARRTQRRVDSVEAALKYISAIVGQRETASTKSNTVSSRSHLILSLNIKKTPLLEGDKTKPVDSLVNFVDLAGSETPGKDGAIGIAQKQGVDINLSLTELRGQIRNLQQGNKINNGSHSLSKILKATLTPGSRVILMVMVSPLMINLQASRSSLRMAMDATNASVNGTARLDSVAANGVGKSPPKTPSVVSKTPTRKATMTGKSPARPESGTAGRIPVRRIPGK
ncbi:P-loop containing nucleoside triphosphate hydrolase protein [Xylariaceae sp. FL0255]|nr:P-loop containing nucleoside triphosphate hydrolase protein [Xylariaceae sp. FL0255]